MASPQRRNPQSFDAVTLLCFIYNVTIIVRAVSPRRQPGPGSAPGAADPLESSKIVARPPDQSKIVFAPRVTTDAISHQPACTHSDNALRTCLKIILRLPCLRIDRSLTSMLRPASTYCAAISRQGDLEGERLAFLLLLSGSPHWRFAHFAISSIPESSVSDYATMTSQIAITVFPRFDRNRAMRVRDD